jgi:hypothetical protein
MKKLEIIEKFSYYDNKFYESNKKSAYNIIEISKNNPERFYSSVKFTSNLSFKEFCEIKIPYLIKELTKKEDYEICYELNEVYNNF